MRAAPALQILALGVVAGCGRPAAGPATFAAAATWRALEPGMQVQAIAAPAVPIRWGVAACELGYALRTNMTIRADDMPAAEVEGVFMEGLVRVRPRVEAAGTAELGAAVQVGFMRGETRSPSEALGEGSFAGPRITSEGAGWRELDGPTALWSAAGSWPGLVLFFPDLPQQPTPGAEATWRPLLHEPAATLAVEASRGAGQRPEGTSPPISPPEALEVQVALGRWIRVGAAPAAEFTASWTTRQSLEGAPFDPVEVTSRFEGHYVVLASGRLLHAAVRGEVDAVTSMDGVRVVEHIRHDHELRLVSACDGPVVPATGP